jgi:hypothetical protein
MTQTNRRLTIREISNALNISFGSVQLVLTKYLNMRGVSAKFVPPFCHKNRKNSACRYRWRCVIVRIQIQVSYEVWSLEANHGYTVTILKRRCRVLTGNQIKSIEIKCESHVDRFAVLKELFGAEFVPRGTTENSEYYKGLLERLRTDVRRKRPKKWKNGFVLHRDNTPYHTPLVIQTWYPVISGYSQNLNLRWKETVLTRFQRPKLQRKRVWER